MVKPLQLHLFLLLSSLLALRFPSVLSNEQTRPGLGYALVTGQPADDMTNMATSTPLPAPKMPPAPVHLQWNEVTAICQSNGTELITLAGQLNSTTDIPGDNFTIRFVVDENGDGEVQPGEPVIGQQTLFGSLSVDLPMVFTYTFSAGVQEVCHILSLLDATATDLGDGVVAPLPVPRLFNAGDDQIFCSVSGNSLATSLGITACTSAGYSFQWSALPPANPAMLNDAQSPNPALALNTDDYFGEILTFILETRRTGCMVPVFDTVQLVMPRHANGFFPNDTLQLQAANCASSADLCLDIASRDTALFLLTIDNDTIPLAALDTCPGNQLTVSLMPGSHRVELLEYATGCLSATVVEVRCTQTETVEINILKGTTDTLCLSAEELSGPIVSLFNDCPDGSFVHNEIVGDTCIVLTGYLVGEETACMVACDTNGFCDTTFVELSVGHPLPNGLTDTLLVSFNGSYCFDYNQINIVGPIDTFENICPDASGGVVQFNTDPISHCIFYDALSTGQDTACIRLCDALGHCDTVFFNAVVVPGNVVTDTVFISVDTHTYCIDPDLLPGDIVKVSDICPENNGQQVVFEIDGTCVHYYGIAVGPDTACLRIEDALGNVALVQLEVQVVTVTPRVFYDTVFIGQMATYCLDTLELPGRYETFSILFDTDNPERVSFDHNPVSLCVRYEGLVIGRDSFSIALCDHYGFCDTTSLCIIVAPYFDPPGLTADTASTFKETPVVLDPLANDTIYGGLEDFFILEPPISGSASVNLDGSVTYLPDPPFCARWDQFAYVACNPNGCDTTSVSIFIECVELTIFNAVSPNNDGVNDYFYIAKIENFPNNRLWVYNRWGNQVFDSGTEGYKNNWPGTWGDDIDLPDGTYYYILEWSDNGITTVQRGYFEMYR